MGGKRIGWNDQPSLRWRDVAFGCGFIVLGGALGAFLWIKFIEWVVAVRPLA